MVMETCCELCVAKHHGVGRSPWDHGCQTFKSPLKLQGAFGRNVDTCDIDANRDLT